MRVRGVVAAGLLGLSWFAALARPPAARPSADRAASYLGYFEVRELLSEGQNEQARARLEQVLETDPGAADLHAALARLCLKEGDVLCAEARARRAAELAPDLAEAHRVLAEIHLQRHQRAAAPGALDEALKEFAAAAAVQPGDSGTWMAWVRTLASEGRTAEAEDVARRAAAVPGLDPSAPWMVLARVLLAGEGAEAAIALLDRIDPQQRSSPALLEMLADLKGGAGDLAGQAAALEQLRRVRPDDGDAAHRLGAVRLELGDFFGALAPLQDAYAMRPGDPLVRRDLARALVRLGRGGEALPLLRRLPPVHQTPHTLLLWAQAAEQAGLPAEAAEQLETLLTKLSDADLATYGPSVRLQAARSWLRAGRTEKALALARAEKDDPAALRLVLDALDAAGRSAEADALLEARRAAAPASPAVIALLAKRAARIGGRAAGLDAALANLRRAEGKGAAAAEVATWLTAWEAPQLGASLLDAVGLSENPSPQQLRARATTLHAAGRLGEAEAAFRRLIELDPQDDAALNDLGFLLADEGRSLEEAVKMLEKAVQLRPEEPVYLDSLGWALHRAGRSSEALPLLQKAAQKAREREEPVIREHLGDVYFALGDADRAQAEWQAALAMGSAQDERLRKKLDDLRAGRGER